MLKVRARNPEHLKALFPTQHIEESTGTDYRWRVFVPKAEFAEWAKKQVEGIAYDNFKNSVDDHDLHDLYADFWTLHWKYQFRIVDRIKKAIPKVKGTTTTAAKALAKAAFGKRDANSAKTNKA